MKKNNFNSHKAIPRLKPGLNPEEIRNWLAVWVPKADSQKGRDYFISLLLLKTFVST